MAKKAVPKLQKALEDRDIKMVTNTIYGMGETANINHFRKNNLHSSHGSSIHRGSVTHCRIKVVVLNVIMLCKDHN